MNEGSTCAAVTVNIEKPKSLNDENVQQQAKLIGKYQPKLPTIVVSSLLALLLILILFIRICHKKQKVHSQHHYEYKEEALNADHSNTEKAQNIKFESKTLNKENVTDESEHFTSVVTTSEHLKIDNQEDKKDNISEDSAHTAFSAGTSYCKSKDELCTLHGVEKQYIEDANSSVEQENDADESFNFEIVENAERDETVKNNSIEETLQLKTQQSQELVVEPHKLPINVVNNPRTITNIIDDLKSAIISCDIDQQFIKRQELEYIMTSQEVERIIDTTQLTCDFSDFLKCDDLPSCEMVIKNLKDKDLMNEASKDIDKSCTERYVHKRQKRIKTKIRRKMLQMSQARVSEIRSYQFPPSGVQEVMTSVLILLGYPIRNIQMWNQIQGILGRTGKKSLLRKIYVFEPHNVSKKQALQAKRILKNFSLNSVAELSAGLALFYVFAHFVIEEVQEIPEAKRKFKSLSIDMKLKHLRN